MNNNCRALVKAYDEKDDEGIGYYAFKIMLETPFSEHSKQFLWVTSNITTEAYWRSLEVIGEKDKQLMIDGFREVIFMDLTSGGFILGKDFSATPSGMVAVTPKAKVFLLERNENVVTHYLECAEG